MGDADVAVGSWGRVEFLLVGGIPVSADVARQEREELSICELYMYLNVY